MRIQQRRHRRTGLEQLNRSRSRKQPKKFSKSFIISFVLIVLIATFFFYGKNFKANVFSNPVEAIIPKYLPTITTEQVNFELGESKFLTIDPSFSNLETNINNKTKYTLSGDKLSFNFSKEDIGKKYSVTLSNSKQDKVIYNIDVNLKQIDINILKQKITKDLGNEFANYGIYIKDLKRNQSLSINGQIIYPPASITKVPIALLVLRDIQSGRFTLDQTFPMKQSYKIYDFDGFSYIPNGKEVTLDNYISTMLRESDNTAMTALENILTDGNGIKGLNNRYRSELGIDTFFRDPFEAKADDIGKVFESIYSGTYLDKERNDYLLNILFNTAERFQDRIQAGVEGQKDTTVAHKIGQVVTETGYSYNDAGIVYGPKTDFVIVVIDQGIGEAEARQTIVNTTKLTFEFLEN